MEGDDAKDKQDAQVAAILDGDASSGAAQEGNNKVVPDIVDIAIPQRDPYEDTLRWMSAWDAAADKAGFVPPATVSPNTTHSNPSETDGSHITRGGLFSYQANKPLE